MDVYVDHIVDVYIQESMIKLVSFIYLKNIWQFFPEISTAHSPLILKFAQIASGGPVYCFIKFRAHLQCCTVILLINNCLVAVHMTSISRDTYSTTKRVYMQLYT